MNFEVIRSQLKLSGENHSAFGDTLRSCRHDDFEYTVVEWVLFSFLVAFSFASVVTAVWHKRICSRIHHLRVAMEVLPSEAQLHKAAMGEPEEQHPATGGTEEGLDIGERPIRTAEQE